MRAAVIGVGTMGRNHARVYAELEETVLVAVADLNQPLAEQVASQFGAGSYDSYLAMLDKEAPDVVSIAVPTQEHMAVACAAMERGVSVLVEKPIASTVEEAAEMIRTSERHGASLSVGHVERFNPAVTELKRRLDAGQLGRIFEIKARRLGPFPSRIRDVGVVIDLATHDLDIMAYLVSAPVERVYAETARRIHRHYEDLLLGFLKFADGTLAVLEINWLTPTKIRDLIVTGERGMLVANYLTQELWFYEHKHSEMNWDAVDVLCGVSDGNKTKFWINQREPLKEELREFVAAVGQGRVPKVTGWDGLHALALAHEVIESSEAHQAVILRSMDGRNARVCSRTRENRIAIGGGLRIQRA